MVATIANGRTGMMPPWGEVLGARGVEDMLSYVLGLSGRKLEAGDPRAGAAKYAELCAACHGPDAHGNPVLGAPNLTDGVWLHGGSLAAVRDSIEKGRIGAMPAHADAPRRDARQTTGGVRVVAGPAGATGRRQRGQRR